MEFPFEFVTNAGSWLWNGVGPALIVGAVWAVLRKRILLPVTRWNARSRAELLRSEYLRRVRMMSDTRLLILRKVTDIVFLVGLTGALLGTAVITALASFNTTSTPPNAYFYFAAIFYVFGILIFAGLVLERTQAEMRYLERPIVEHELFMARLEKVLTKTNLSDEEKAQFLADVPLPEAMSESDFRALMEREADIFFAHQEGQGKRSARRPR
jgi:hypothetical protein